MHSLIAAARARWRWLVFALLPLAALSALGYYQWGYLPAQAQEQAGEIQTSTARRGDLVLYASGSGSLVTGREYELGFGAAGEVAELHVQPGDQVSSGDLLAVQSDIEEIEAEVETAKLAVLEAERELQEVRDNAGLAAAEAAQSLASAQEALDEAEYTRRVMQKGNRASSTTIKAAEANLVTTETAMARAKARYDSTSGDLDEDPDKAAAYKEYASARQAYESALSNLNWYTGEPSEIEQAQYDSAVAVAEAELAAAERTYQLLQAGADPLELQRAEVALAQAKVDLAAAEENLELANLVAPIDGTILTVSAAVGDQVSASFITMADLSDLYVEFDLDESDLDRVELDNPIEVIFDAQPDSIYSGRVSQLDPVLSSDGPAATISGKATLDPASGGSFENLMVGMSAAVDVIAARADDAVLIPTEAVREIGDGEYAVFVVEEGELLLRPVEVGLSDVSFTAITSGLAAGEVVSTGQAVVE